MDRKSNYGWVVLVAFTLVAGMSQMLWLNFAPILSVIRDKYQISESMAGNLLIMIFPLLYVVLSIPAGIWIDRAGYKKVVMIGSIVMAISSIIRIFDDAFMTIFIGQLGIAIAQPFIMNAISKLVGDWFKEEQHAMATGIGTVGMFVGMAAGFALTPMFVEGTNIRSAMIIFAVITVISTLAFIFLAREKGDLSDAEEGPTFELMGLLQNKNLLILSILSFLALGYFNGLTTWLELILSEQGVGIEDAGLIGGVLILGGIVGAAIIPAISDKMKKRKPFLILAIVMGVLLVYPLTTGSHVPTLLLLGAITGALFLPGYAILLTMAEEEVGARKAGAATGILMLGGNAGGVVIIILMDVLKSMQGVWLYSIILLIAVMIIGLAVSFLTKETFDKSALDN